MLGRRLVVTALALLAVGCSSGSTSTTRTTSVPQSLGSAGSTTTTLAAPREKPEDFIKRHITEEANGQWGLAYADLLPQQQAVITKATFINCGNKTSIPQLVSISVVKVYTENTPTPGAGDQDSTAVTVKITFQKIGAETQTIHAYNVNGAWRASVDQPTLDAESKGECAP